MAATIKIKNSSTASAVPTSSDLVQGELAVNVTDKRIFTENASGTVVELGTNPTSIALPAGSASAPTLLASGDTNTGIFFPAADTVAVTTGGSERARVDSSGNLGLGVTPSSWVTLKGLEIAGLGNSVAGYPADAGMYVSSNAYYGTGGWRYGYSSKLATLYSAEAGVHKWSTAASGTAGNAITFTQAMTLDASGNLGVGTTSPTSVSNYKGITLNGTTGGLVDIASNGTVGLRLQCDTGYPGGALFTLTNQPMIFGTNGSERARIDSSGNLLVNTTTLPSSSGSGVQIYNNSGQAGRLNIGKNTSGLFNAIANYYSGTYVGGVNYDNTSTSFPTSSDVRLKKDIVDAGSASAKIDQIRIVSHGWKHDDAVVEFGVIAQELVNVAPQAVSAGDDGEEIETTWGVDYSKLVPMLIKAHQEQQAIIQQLQADVAALKG